MTYYTGTILLIIFEHIRLNFWNIMGWYDNISNLKTLLLHQLIINSWEKKNPCKHFGGKFENNWLLRSRGMVSNKEKLLHRARGRPHLPRKMYTLTRKTWLIAQLNSPFSHIGVKTFLMEYLIFYYHSPLSFQTRLEQGPVITDGRNMWILSKGLL